MPVSLAELQKQAYAIACARGLWPDTGLRREVGAEGPVWRETFEFVGALRDYVVRRDTWEHVTEIACEAKPLAGCSFQRT